MILASFTEPCQEGLHAGVVMASVYCEDTCVGIRFEENNSEHLLNKIALFPVPPTPPLRMLNTSAQREQLSRSSITLFELTGLCVCDGACVVWCLHVCCVRVCM